MSKKSCYGTEECGCAYCELIESLQSGMENNSDKGKAEEAKGKENV